MPQFIDLAFTGLPGRHLGAAIGAGVDADRQVRDGAWVAELTGLLDELVQR